jgi:CRP-like cAMP-binding protein
MSKENSDSLQTSLHKLGFESTLVQNLFLESCTIKQYNKNQLIFSEDKRNDLEYILFDGVLHRFNVNEQGENVTTGFYMDNAVVTPHFARTIKGKSIFSLEALTASKIAEIPVAVFDSLRCNNPAFALFGQRVLEAELSSSILTDIGYRSSTAKERLSLLRKTYPNIENLIPNHIIASYLGITPVSFSRLRKEYAGK